MSPRARFKDGEVALGVDGRVRIIEAFKGFISILGRGASLSSDVLTPNNCIHVQQVKNKK